MAATAGAVTTTEAFVDAVAVVFAAVEVVAGILVTASGVLAVAATAGAVTTTEALVVTVGVVFTVAWVLSAVDVVLFACWLFEAAVGEAGVGAAALQEGVAELVDGSGVLLLAGRRSWTDHFNPILFSFSMYSFFNLSLP